ncbi:MAG: hypothetical protein MK102_19340 [Fuerstiella sp.]|nr:hypothetical protein [Fuerstiella sp.]
MSDPSLREESASRSSQPSVAALDVEHTVEINVRRELLSHPTLQFASLVIRRIDDGVCLEGVLDTNGDTADVCTLARKVAGVEQVLNHLVTHGAEMSQDESAGGVRGVSCR